MSEDEGGREREREQEQKRRRECELCGTRVPAAAYHEHLLKECPGERE